MTKTDESLGSPKPGQENDGSIIDAAAADLFNTDSNVPFQLYKTQTTALVSREEFLDVVCHALTLYKYVGPNQRADLLLACRYTAVQFATNLQQIFEMAPSSNINIILLPFHAYRYVIH